MVLYLSHWMSVASALANPMGSHVVPIAGSTKSQIVEAMHGRGGRTFYIVYEMDRIYLQKRFIIILSQNSSAIPNDVHVHACKASLTLRRVYLHKRKIFGNPNSSKYRLLSITSSPAKGLLIEETLIT